MDTTREKQAPQHDSNQARAGTQTPETSEAQPLPRFLNQPISARDMVAALGLEDQPNVQAEFEKILACREQVGGMFRSLSNLAGVLEPSRQAELLV